MREIITYFPPENQTSQNQEARLGIFHKNLKTKTKQGLFEYQWKAITLIFFFKNILQNKFGPIKFLKLLLIKENNKDIF